MLNIILNIIGLILVIFSIYLIFKDIRKQNKLVNNLDSIENKLKEYYKLTEEIAGNFDDIIEYKLDAIDNKINNKILKDIKNKDIEDKNIKVEDNESNEISNIIPIHKKVIELKEIGLTKEEIAKKLNKGIREIEIILKIYEIKK
ncbi:hypothetical protein KQI41_09105 [Tissierella pigra]|uniref:Uncharacterized protein n=1 Tax=Tissierella pigra TaxID=2607614 RepID=A0A6N7XU28_9FIRM|nr:hypothetical protein [Tissierella pigra]MBU5426560.1 hypothetical protein [Tissierella pigra]MST99994.1 hypothetical protein [Tissierella pigra]